MTGKYWDRAWSLVDGCTPCSPGCDHCWSMAMGKRFKKWPDRVTIRPGRLDTPLKTRKPTVFCLWNDLFHEDVQYEFIVDTFRHIGGTGHHTYLILTKRPQRMYDFITDKNVKMVFKRERRAPIGIAWHHVWLGVTVCNQQEANEKIPLLLQTPAAHRWISIEPMLGPVDVSWSLGKIVGTKLPSIDAVILGGETGPGARPLHPDWVRSVRDQCQSAGVPFFLKSLGRGKGRELDGKEHNDLPWKFER